MAIETIDNFGVYVGKNIDSRYGPYVDTTDANNAIDEIFRYRGLTVLITGSGDIIEYWYYEGIDNADLIPKGAAISITGVDGQVVFYSGSDAISGSPNFTFNYTSSTPSFNVSGTISSSYGPNTIGFYGTASWALNTLTASFVTASNVYGPFGSSSVLSASYALHGGDVTEIVAGTNVTISPPEGTGSVTINASAAAGSGVSIAATASFTNATIWNFNHNLQSRYVIIQALDTNHNQIIPETIELIDTSSARLTFPTPESGYAMATIGGTTASVSLTSLEVLTNNGGKIYSSGNNLVIDPVNDLIISGNMIPGPPYTNNTSSYDLGSPTAAWNHLYVSNGSITFISGSNSASISYINGNLSFPTPLSGSFTGSFFGTASWAQSASQAISSSRTTSASYALSSSYTLSSSYALSASYALSSSYALSASYALSSSYALSASLAFTASYLNILNQNLIISGNIIPAGPYTNNTSSYDLGSSTAAWRDLYVSNGSIKMISGSNSASIQFNNGTVTFAGASVTLPSSSTVPTASYVTPYEGAWTSYTPIWTAASVNPSINNGTVQGWYKLVGKTCFVRGNIVMGSTTTFGSGEWYVSMPFTASHADAILMTANLLDNGTAWYNATVNGARAGFNYKAPIQYQGGAGTALDVNATQPYTWASTDRFLWNGSYEIA
jgi:hypothetical protein